jgi:thiol-disulfide isomerase/thioredoxin
VGTVSRRTTAARGKARSAGGRPRSYRGLIAVLGGAGVLAVAVAVALLAGGGRTAAPTPAEPPASGGLDAGALVPKAGTGPALPAFTLSSFGGDGTVSASDFGGRPLVLNFWASWCPFCVEEMPGFEQVHQELGDAVAFLGVDLQDDPKLARDLVGRTGVTYQLAVDPDGSLFAAVGGTGMPTTLLVSADGRIEEHVTGPLTAEQLRELILEELFEGA